MLADSLKRSSEFTVRLNLAQTGRAEMCSGCRERLPRLSLRSAAASAHVLCQGNWIWRFIHAYSSSQVFSSAARRL